MSAASANSALQRARETLKRRRAGALPPVVAPVDDATQRTLLERYVRAWERLDVDAFVALLKEDALFSMPPLSEHYRGHEAIRRFLPTAFARTGYDSFKLVPVHANEQPAFALYGRDSSEPETSWEAHAIMVLTLHDDRIAALTLFLETGLFELFKLPLELSKS
jgi:RNA polymerase sigma-70 factor (ECF subfamily)